MPSQLHEISGFLSTMIPVFLLVSLCTLAACGGTAPESSIVVIAHRGIVTEAPENTIPAIEASIAHGADYVEIDIRTTSDGELVLLHNRTVDGHTDGTGHVREMTLEQVRALDAGSWFDSTFTGTRVPTADEAFAAARGRIGIYVDIKDAKTEDIVELVRRHDMFESVFVYDGADSLRRMKELEPRLQVMIPRPPQDLTELADLVAEVGNEYFCSSTRDITRERVDSCHAHNVKVYVNVMHQDDPTGWQMALDCGADGLETDRTEQVLAYLREHGLHR